MSEKNVSSVVNCCGCLACIDVCPQHCIIPTADMQGFVYPYVDGRRCVDCGVCLKVCPETHPAVFQAPVSVDAAWREDEAVRDVCTSGGIATTIAESVVASGGGVYGCAFVPPWHFGHVRCSTQDELWMLCGSKYVQSDMLNAYSLIREDLKEGRNVLFIGTPCQVAGVLKRFSRFREQLCCVDILCHGVPSSLMLKDSLLVDGVDGISFRKNNTYQISYQACGKVVSRPLYRDLYLKGFLKGVTLRKSCHHCKYAQSRRVGDLTLGDFWGYEGNGQGVSLCLVNNEKGQRLLRMCNNAHVEQASLELAVAYNQPLRGSIHESWRSKIFGALYPRYGFRFAAICAMPDIVLKNMLLRK